MKSFATLASIVATALTSNLASASYRVEFPSIVSVALGHQKTLEALQASTERLQVNLQLASIEAAQFAPSKFYVCMELRQVGPDFIRPLGYLRAKLNERNLGGRGGSVLEVTTVETLSPHSTTGCAHE